MNNDQGNIENYIDLENYGKSKIIFLKIMIFSRFFSFADFSVLQIFQFCRFLSFADFWVLQIFKIFKGDLFSNFDRILTFSDVTWGPR